MVIYKVPQEVIDEANKNRVLSIITYYTFKEGGVDLEKINPTTILQKFGISLEDAKKSIQSLISEGKVVKII